MKLYLKSPFLGRILSRIASRFCVWLAVFGSSEVSVYIPRVTLFYLINFIDFYLTYILLHSLLNWEYNFLFRLAMTNAACSLLDTLVFVALHLKNAELIWQCFSLSDNLIVLMFFFLFDCPIGVPKIEEDWVKRKCSIRGLWLQHNFFLARGFQKIAF